MYNKMFQENNVTPRTYQDKKNELEKWIVEEKNELRKTQAEIEKGFKRALDSIDRYDY